MASELLVECIEHQPFCCDWLKPIGIAACERLHESGQRQQHDFAPTKSQKINARRFYCGYAIGFKPGLGGGNSLEMAGKWSELNQPLSGHHRWRGQLTRSGLLKGRAIWHFPHLRLIWLFQEARLDRWL
jgi:hypothetical protein